MRETIHASALISLLLLIGISTPALANRGDSRSCDRDEPITYFGIKGEMSFHCTNWHADSTTNFAPETRDRIAGRRVLGNRLAGWFGYDESGPGHCYVEDRTHFYYLGLEVDASQGSIDTAIGFLNPIKREFSECIQYFRDHCLGDFTLKGGAFPHILGAESNSFIGNRSCSKSENSFESNPSSNSMK